MTKMNNLINVRMGQLYVSDNEKISFETILGSCVAVCLYNQEKKIAGIAHIMLPKNPNRDKRSISAGKYADEAIETLLRRIMLRGGEPERLHAKLIGGSDMFSHESGKQSLDIGKRNIEFVKIYLKQKKIPIISEDLGGMHGRKIVFDVKTGKIICKKEDKENVL